jgi:hypothetical protein
VSGLLARRLLRASAIVIAVLAWLDPSYAGRSRPRIAVIDAASSAPARAADVAAKLAAEAIVTTHKDPDADAWVVVADDEEAAIPAPPDAVALSLIVPAPSAQSVVVDSLDAPARSRPRDRVPIVATFAARGVRGAQTTFVLRSGDLPLARQTHTWTREDERLTVRFDVLLPSPVINHLIVEAVEGPGRSRRSRADTVVSADAARVSVLIYEGRPSWTTTFARRAIEDDGAFFVSAVARLSRGISAIAEPRKTSIDLAWSPPRPVSSLPLSSTLLDGHHVAIVGAPETLTAAEVESLRVYATRGGVVVLAPDLRPSGPYVSLLLQARLDERLLEDAIRLPLADAPSLSLMASELVEARVPAGGQAMAPGRHADTASIWTAPLGRGRVLFVGALDAWRFRGRKEESFDRWWPRVVEWLGRDRVDARLVSSEPRVAAPGEPVALRVRADVSDTGESAMRVAIGPAGQPGDRRQENVLRLWPDAEAGVYRGVINAPERPGVYAVSARSGPAGGGARETASLAPLIVDEKARRARHADDRWRIATGARGGIVATPDDVARVVQAIRPRADRAAPADRRFPMRSLWWLLPFTACLGGEWWLRRRAGLR